MEIPNTELLMCDDHINHNKKWMINQNGVPFCVACGVIILDDSTVNDYRKRFILNIVNDHLKIGSNLIQMFLTDDNNQHIHYDHIFANETVIIMIKMLIKLINSKDIDVSRAAIQCLINVLTSIDDENLNAFVFKSIVSHIMETDIERSYNHIYFMSKSIGAFPISTEILLNRDFNFMGKLISQYEGKSDTIKTEILYVLIQIYKCDNLPPYFVFDTDLHIEIVKMCFTAMSVKTDELILNSLGLSYYLINYDCAIQMFLNEPIIPSLFSVMLMGDNESVKIGASQLIVRLLKSPFQSECSKMVIESNLFDRIIELLSLSKDKTLKESLLCCIMLTLEKCQSLPNKWHPSYAVESIINSFVNTYDIEENLVLIGISSLLLLVKKFPHIKVINDRLYFSILNVLENSFSKCILHTKSLQLFSAILCHTQTPNPIPTERIMNIYDYIIKIFTKIYSLNDRTRDSSNIIECFNGIMMVIAALIKLKVEVKDDIHNNPMEYESTKLFTLNELELYDEKNHFETPDLNFDSNNKRPSLLYYCLKSLDNRFDECGRFDSGLILIAYEYCINTRQSLQILEHLCTCLTLILHLDSTDEQKLFCQSMFTKGFVHFLYKLIVNRECDPKKSQDLATVIISSVIEFIAFQVNDDLNQNEDLKDDSFNMNSLKKGIDDIMRKTKMKEIHIYVSRTLLIKHCVSEKFK